jgi:hypothetical protein
MTWRNIESWGEEEEEEEEIYRQSQGKEQT